MKRDEDDRSPPDILLAFGVLVVDPSVRRQQVKRHSIDASEQCYSKVNTARAAECDALEATCKGALRGMTYGWFASLCSTNLLKRTVQLVLLFATEMTLPCGEHCQK